MMGVLTRICLFAAALLCVGCCTEPTDYFCDDPVMLDKGSGISCPRLLSPEERQVLNAYIAENASCWNKSYVTYAPMGITLLSSRAKICITSLRVILSVKHSADGEWYQYVKGRDATDAVLLKIFE